MSKGGRNLIILGIIATIITCITCGVSLYLYHDSGDIYLDRSRPGFLPDEDEKENEAKTDYTFKEDGTITDGVIDEYLKEIDNELKAIDDIKDPFSADPLSDESLGIDHLTFIVTGE